jgi:hypothetical protein
LSGGEGWEERIERIIHKELANAGFEGYELLKPISLAISNVPRQSMVYFFVKGAAIKRYPEIDHIDMGLRYERLPGRMSTDVNLATVELKKDDPSEEDYAPYYDVLRELGQSILQSLAGTFAQF